jgi:hypothetical protein
LKELARAARIRREAHGENAIVIVREAHEGNSDLSQLAGALNPPRARPDALDSGKEQCGKNRNNCDHDEKLEQCETVAPGSHSRP